MTTNQTDTQPLARPGISLETFLTILLGSDLATFSARATADELAAVAILAEITQ